MTDKAFVAQKQWVVCNSCLSSHSIGSLRMHLSLRQWTTAWQVLQSVPTSRFENPYIGTERMFQWIIKSENRDLFIYYLTLHQIIRLKDNFKNVEFAATYGQTDRRSVICLDGMRKSSGCSGMTRTHSLVGQLGWVHSVFFSPCRQTLGFVQTTALPSQPPPLQLRKGRQVKLTHWENGWTTKINSCNVLVTEPQNHITLKLPI